MANKIPTILIGIGGIGSKIVAETFKTLSEEDKETIAAVCMDTDSSTFDKYSGLGLDGMIQTSTNEIVGDYLKKDNKMRSWFQRNPLLETKSLIEGAGQIRQLSRMAAQVCIENNIRDDLGRAIDKVNKAGSIFEKSLKVFIVGSIAGGTGAGLMVQLPFFVRELIEEKTARDHILIRGLFIGPTVTEEYQHNNVIKKTATYANAYACLKEINGFYLKASGVNYDIPIEVDYYKEGRIPYDFLFLIDRQKCKGGVLASGRAGNYLEMAKECLRAQLTPIGEGMYSAEDNLILTYLEGRGMNRYCSAGATNILYPLESINDYCAYKWSEETIKEQWIKIDDDFKRKQMDDRDRQAMDPGYVPETEDSYYVSQFEKLSAPGSSDVLFKNLRADLNAVVREAEEKSSVLSLTEAIRRFTEESAVSDKVNESRAACEVDMNSIIEPPEGEEDTVVIGVLERLEEYLKTIKSNQKHVFSTIDSIMPSAIRRVGGSNDRYADHDYNVFYALRKVHPIVARYILHRLKKELGELLDAESRTLFKQQSRLNMMKDVDFDDETEGINSPKETYMKLMTEMDGGMLKKLRERFSKNQSKLEDFAELFRTKVNEQREIYRKYNLAYYSVAVYEELLERIDELLNVYKVFFETLPAVARNVRYEIEKIENMHNEASETTARYVFADKNCKRLAYDILQNKSRMNDMELPKEVKARFADDIYDLFVEYYNNTRGVSEETKEGYRKHVSKRAKNLYNDSIFKGLRLQTSQYVNTYLDFGAIKALECELIFEKMMRETDRNLEMAVNAFLKSLDDYDASSIKNEFEEEIGKIISRSTPFMLIHGNPRDEAVYWGMHPSLFERKDNGEPDLERMGERVSFKGSTPSMLVDKDFSRNSVVCYHIMYAVFAEEIATYDCGSKAYECYCDRINILLDQAKGSNDSDDYEYGVTPHIDKRWHKEAYLPHLIPAEAERERDESYLAFMSMLMFDDIVDINEYNGKKRWEYTKSLTPYDIKIDGKLTAPTYVSLMKSVRYNPLIKRELVAMINEMIEEDERNTSNIEEDIFEHKVIKGFGQVQDILGTVVGDGSDTITALDLMAELEAAVGENEFNRMIRFFRGYIWRYCERMSDRFEQCKKLYGDIMNRLLEVSQEKSRDNATIKNLVKYKE